ncbi:NifB/NifX family molybdenum-iron cluster-binding protein [Nautilia lithotrophica]
MKIAFPTSNEKTICEFIPFCKFFLIYDTETKEKKIIDNPLYQIVKEKNIKKRDCGENGLHTGEIIPPLLKNYHIDLFIAIKLGEGMLDNLEIYDIKYKLTDEKEIKSFL